MSKRYREVLEEVETPQSRAANRASTEASARSTNATAGDATAGPAMVDVDGDVVRSGGSGGGVATLVRPTAVATESSTVPDQALDRGSDHAPDPARPTVRPGPRRPGRSTHPGNGPADAEEPLAFAWRGRRYEVTRILGHWREEEGWWRRPDGEPIRIEQSDLWRVEATRETGSGVYELARRGTTWRLDRVWD